MVTDSRWVLLNCIPRITICLSGTRRSRHKYGAVHLEAAYAVQPPNQTCEKYWNPNHKRNEGVGVCGRGLSGTENKVYALKNTKEEHKKFVQYSRTNKPALPMGLRDKQNAACDEDACCNKHILELQLDFQDQKPSCKKSSRPWGIYASVCPNFIVNSILSSSFRVPWRNTCATTAIIPLRH